MEVPAQLKCLLVTDAGISMQNVSQCFRDFGKVFGMTLDSTSHSREHCVPDDHLIVLFAVLVYAGVAYFPVGWPKVLSDSESIG